MISIVLLEQYGIPKPGLQSRPIIPQRPLPSVYFRKPVKLHNPKDLSDDAPEAKKIWRQHVVKAKPYTAIGYDPIPGQQLTAKVARA